ncbi:MAG: hypothetical protein L0211_22935 [Planctomycetaceae bacterium]|nr:hypothetical protein [Planctomycetaceae bacterium]
MLQAPNSKRNRSWLRPTFSLGTLMWLMLVAGMAMVWWKDRSSLDARLKKLEQMYSPMREPLWGAADILGAPDDPTGGAGKSWCPAGTNTADWIEVGFDNAVAAATIDLYETYLVGCVTEVIVIDQSGSQTTIWKGTDPTPRTARTGLFRVPVPGSTRSVQRVKIHVDSTGKGSWACFDAVGLTTAAGKTTWATSSNSSSVYGGGSLSASSKKASWFSLW